MWGSPAPSGFSFRLLQFFASPFFDIDLHRAEVQRSTVGAGSLALLFIVAQIGQNFFSAEFGLLVGGIVAGTFLFAAQPVQRALESGAFAGRTRRSPATRVGSETSDSVERREPTYRLTVGRFLANGPLGPADEIALGHLADSLRIGAGRAAELRHEVSQAQAAK
jgi:hypothetical protein